MCGFDHDTPFQSIVVFGLNMIHTLVINLVSRALLDLVWKPTDPKAEKLLGAAAWGSENDQPLQLGTNTFREKCLRCEI